MKAYIEETSEYLKSKGFTAPDVGIILGTGLSKILDHIDIQHEVSYNHIPNFPTATVEFHKGKLIYGTLEGKNVIVMQGRFHLYEGYTLTDVTYPVRVMHELGIKHLLVSNASGAINTSFKKGEMMLIDDRSLQALPSTVTIIRNVRLYQGVDYRFRVQGKEWQFSNNYGFGGEFGVNSTFYDGTNLDPDGSQSDASRASLTITLVKPE